MNDSRLETFLARIYVDRKARAKFLADPRGEATKAGLTAQQVEDVIKIDRDGLELFAQSLERKSTGRERRPLPDLFYRRVAFELNSISLVGTGQEGATPSLWSQQMIRSITSRDNSLLRLARAVRDGKNTDYVFVEGLRLCQEALRSALEIEAVIVSEELLLKERAGPAIAELDQATQRSASVSEKLLESISYTKTPQGIVVLARRPESTEHRLSASIDKNSLLVVLHQINNPVNVGAIVRTAEAAGAGGVITTRNTSDPFSPKSLRGAMGSAFRMPIWAGPGYEEMIEWCRKRNIATVCADAEATLAHTDFNWTQATALVLGPESTGLSDAETRSANHVVSIRMHGAVESLNVSVAAGILLFEAARQRSL